MAQIVVRNIEKSIHERLRSRARRNSRSMEEEVRNILRTAVKDEAKPRTGLAIAIAKRFAHTPFDIPIEEQRGHPAIPMEFPDR